MCTRGEGRWPNFDVAPYLQVRRADGLAVIFKKSAHILHNIQKTGFPDAIVSHRTVISLRPEKGTILLTRTISTYRNHKFGPLTVSVTPGDVHLATRLWLTLAVCVVAGCATQSVPGEAGAGRHSASSEVKDIGDLAEVAPVLQSGSGAMTLLVLDIDDTLLTSSVFFGSDSWYEWQKGLSADDPGKVACRFDVIAMNYETGTQVPTQPDGPEIVNSLAADKVILTSRSPVSRGATIRELQHAGYSLPASLSSSDDGVTFRWLPGSSMRPVDVSYDDGVYMISGQDKGVLLLELLRRVHRRFERVILVDDGPRNIEAVRIAMERANVDYIGLHYTRIDKAVSPGDVKEGVQGWQAWRRFLSGTFPQRLERMDAGDCAY